VLGEVFYSLFFLSAMNSLFGSRLGMVYHMVATGQRVLPLVPRFLGRKLELEAGMSKTGYIKVMVASLRARCYVRVHTGLDEVLVALNRQKQKKKVNERRRVLSFFFSLEKHTHTHKE
jgi:hypothetical protein